MECKKKGAAVEWMKESFAFVPVVMLRIRSPDGGRVTVHATDSTYGGVPLLDEVLHSVRDAG
jgi:hypothetical protein